MTKTLLDYILSNVSNAEIKQFETALAKFNTVTSDSGEGQKIADLLTKFYESRNKSIWNKLFGPDVDPFDLTAEEVERLSRVYRDPDEQVKFNLVIPLTDLKVRGFDLNKLKALINKTYADNRLFFDSARDIDVVELKDERGHLDKVEIVYKGNKDVAIQMLTTLKYDEVQNPKISKILLNKVSPKDKSYFSKTIKIPAKDFAKEFQVLKQKAIADELATDKDSNRVVFNKLIARFKEKNPELVDELRYLKPIGKGVLNDLSDMQLQYKGSIKTLEFFLESMNVPKGVIDRLINQVKG